MEQIMNYIKPELFVMVFVLYFFRACLEKAQFVKDKYIPFALGITGILVCGVWVLGSCPLGNFQEIAIALFTAIVQGVLAAGLSTYVDQLAKRRNKEDRIVETDEKQQK